MASQGAKDSRIIYLFIICILVVLDIDLIANRLLKSEVTTQTTAETPVPTQSTGVIQTPITQLASNTPSQLPPGQNIPPAAIPMSSIEIINFSSLTVDVEIYDSLRRQISKFALSAAQGDSKTISAPFGSYIVSTRKANGEMMTSNVTIKDKLGEILRIK